MRIAYVSTEWGRDEAGNLCIPGGSAWARVHQPGTWLNNNGHDVAIGQGMASRGNGRIIPLDWHDRPLMADPEIVVLQRWMHADGPEAVKAARAAGQIVLVDVDDWLWRLDPRNLAAWGTSKRRDPDHNRDWYRKIIECADAATVSSGFLARRVRERMGTPTILLRNMVDMPSFDPQLVKDTRDGLVVGWVGALGWRSGDLEVLRGSLPDFLERVDGTFVHHGVFPFDEDTAAERAGVPAERAGPTMPARAPWWYPELMRGFDVGVVPLSDQPFNHAKSWIKGLEYAAAGIPFIATRTAEYEALGCGLLAGNALEWEAAFRRLRDPDERARVREAGLNVARRNDVRYRGRDWETSYQALLGYLAKV